MTQDQRRSQPGRAGPLEPSRSVRADAGPEHPSREGRTILTTGMGSMPGTDPAPATRIVVGELDVPHVVELPARGPGADLLGRSMALVCAATGEFAATTTPSGWALEATRAGGAAGRQMRRAAAWLAEDCDRLEEALVGFEGLVKVQLAGPWTLAAGVESARGTRLVADPGACADLAAALAESVARHVGDLRRRVPGGRVVVQLDEPSLPTVAAGRVATASGRGVLRTPGPAELLSGLAVVVDAAEAAGAVQVVAHCCARGAPLDLFGQAGFRAAAVDLRLADDEALGRWWDAGLLVVLGVAPAVDPPGPAARSMPESLVGDVAALWGRIGFPLEAVAERTWLSPACGLAGASPQWARRVGGLLRRAAVMLEAG